MKITEELRQEIIRYVALTKGARAFDVVEGLRNRWQKRLEEESGTEGSYAKQMNAVLQSMLTDNGLENPEEQRLTRRQVQAKPVGWISFEWMTPALVNGHKTVTRRDWSDRHAARFRQGDMLHAYDRLPTRGGKPVALIRLTQTPYKQSSSRLSPLDWNAEGFAWLQVQGKKFGKETPREVWNSWQEHPQDLWVIRFEVVELL